VEIDEFLALTKKRRTFRRFKTDPVPDECIEKMLEAARFAQSGGNGQSWEFVVVRNNETKKGIVKLVAESHEQIWWIEKTRLSSNFTVESSKANTLLFSSARKRRIGYYSEQRRANHANKKKEKEKTEKQR
jgi:nitroreductase